MSKARAIILLSIAGCTGINESSTSRSSESLDPHRSLIITDQVILEPAFSFQAVMDQIVLTSGSELTSLELFQQWWSTQNAGPASTPRCDTEKTNGVPSFNGYPWACPRAEGAQASVDPFTPAVGNPNGYTAIALTNRFDLAPADGSHCGEYRIVFAKNSGMSSNTNRNLVIFEAALPNPNPSAGLAACRPVAKFWADLSAVASADERRVRLQQLYFQGLPGFKPVIMADHFGARITAKGHAVARGQIRSNQFMQSPWMLREWRLVRDTRCSLCKMRMVPTTVKNNPWGAFFNPNATPDERGAGFRSELLEHVGHLAGDDLASISQRIDNEHNTGQSVAQGPENNYATHFEAGRTVSPGFAAAIANELVEADEPTLTPRHVVDRSMTQSCAGCHRLSDGADLGDGLAWPSSPMRFVHVSEAGGPTESGPDGPRWAISTGLRDKFLPHRAAVLASFLADTDPANGTGTAVSASLFDPITNLVVLTVAEAGDTELADLAPTEKVVFIGLPDPTLCVLGKLETATADLVPIEQLDSLSLPSLGGGSVH